MLNNLPALIHQLDTLLMLQLMFQLLLTSDLQQHLLLW